MNRSTSRCSLLALALCAIWTVGSSFKFSDLIRNYTLTTSKPASTVKPAMKVTVPEATTFAAPVDAPPVREYVASPGGFDKRLYVQESVTCLEIQSHTETVRAIVDNYDKSALFSDACFLFNTLVSVWEKSDCQETAPARMDCCAEVSSRYYSYFEMIRKSAQWNQCAPGNFATYCQRLNAFKQPCDAMQCQQNCAVGYACSPGGFEQLVRSIHDNGFHPAETDACVRDGYRTVLPQ